MNYGCKTLNYELWLCLGMVLQMIFFLSICVHLMVKYSFKMKNILSKSCFSITLN